VAITTATINPLHRNTTQAKNNIVVKLVGQAGREMIGEDHEISHGLLNVRHLSQFLFFIPIVARNSLRDST